MPDKFCNLNAFLDIPIGGGAVTRGGKNGFIRDKTTTRNVSLMSNKLLASTAACGFSSNAIDGTSVIESTTSHCDDGSEQVRVDDHEEITYMIVVLPVELRVCSKAHVMTQDTLRVILCTLNVLSAFHTIILPSCEAETK